jgi:hypothetical protein
MLALALGRVSAVVDWRFLLIGGELLVGVGSGCGEIGVARLPWYGCSLRRAGTKVLRTSGYDAEVNICESSIKCRCPIMKIEKRQIREWHISRLSRNIKAMYVAMVKQSACLKSSHITIYRANKTALQIYQWHREGHRAAV